MVMGKKCDFLIGSITQNMFDLGSPNFNTGSAFTNTNQGVFFGFERSKVKVTGQNCDLPFGCCGFALY